MKTGENKGRRYENSVVSAKITTFDTKAKKCHNSYGTFSDFDLFKSREV